MRFLAAAVLVVILAVMAFSSSTCHEEVDSPTATLESSSGFNAKGSATVAAATRLATKAPPESTPTVDVETTATVAPSPVVPDRLPTDFPSEVPVIPGSTLAQVQDLANSARNVIFTSDKPVPELVKTYQETLTKAGWRITQQFTRDQHAFATYEKGKMLVNVTVVTDFETPGQNIIAVMYEEQRPLEFDESDLEGE